MNIYHLLTLTLSLTVLAFAQQDRYVVPELKVVETVPALGETDVDPDIPEIGIYFSGEVKQNSWSFVESVPGVFPEIAGEPYFVNPFTCILPVSLKSNTTYSIGINSAARKGFRSVQNPGITVTPYILTFTTGKSAEELLQSASSAKKKPGKKAAQLQKTTQSAAAGTPGKLSTMVFTRVEEPNERAFTILIPKGWQVKGGIFRVDPTAQGGAAQSIAAKLDFAVMKDRQGSVMIRWLPDVLFFDMRYSPAGQMGLFPPGSNYNGMTVYPLIPALQFIRQVAFRYAHPNASNVQVKDRRSLPGLAEQYLRQARALGPMIDFSYDAATATLAFNEKGFLYEERMIAVVENWGKAGAGLWGNKETLLIRAPLHELAKSEAVFSVIQSSVRITPQWLAGEIRGQAQRGEIMLRTQQDMQRIEREITEHRQKTNAEIHNDMFLTLTDQEEFVNPYTNEVETGSNQWKYRWVNEAGDVIYTDKESYDPRVDANLNRTDFKRTPVRKRLPQ